MGPPPSQKGHQKQNVSPMASDRASSASRGEGIHGLQLESGVIEVLAAIVEAAMTEELKGTGDWPVPGAAYRTSLMTSSRGLRCQVAGILQLHVD